MKVDRKLLSKERYEINYAKKLAERTLWRNRRKKERDTSIVRTSILRRLCRYVIKN